MIQRRGGLIHPFAQTFQIVYAYRGVQYVHCAMHKCIMVKLGGRGETKNT